MADPTSLLLREEGNNIGGFEGWGFLDVQILRVPMAHSDGISLDSINNALVLRPSLAKNRAQWSSYPRTCDCFASFNSKGGGSLLEEG